jgi:predicted unusual protein kinase regulating ubiquinone biosynthesis (AarF/ABC1/UbiB family)
MLERQKRLIQHGNLCVDGKGNVVYYDFGMMDELKPNGKDE